MLVDQGSGLHGFADWAEQLVAESTGKQGTGLLPVVVADDSAPEVALPPHDVTVVHLADDTAPDPHVDPSESDAGSTGSDVVVTGTLGAQMLLWEVATATAGRLLGIDPFDQPDVESAKIAARSMLEGEPGRHPGRPHRRSGRGARARWRLAGRRRHAGRGRRRAARRRSTAEQGYLAVMAYLDRIEHADLAEVRSTLAHRVRRPVTFGWGPRFLHSTGQFHKGGPAEGVYLQITGEPAEDLPVPGKDYTFGRLISAQSAGDASVLADHGRPVLRLHLTDPAAGLTALREALTSRLVNPLRDPQDRRLPRIAGPCGLVIFGVTGDLSRKKVMPAIYDLASRGLLPPGFSLVGYARRDWADEDFAQVVHDSVKEHARTEFREEVWQQLAEGFRFVQGDFDDDVAFDHLRQVTEDLDRVRGTGGNHAFYLSIPPKFFPDVIGQLKEHGLADAGRDSWRRVVVEKPFGWDLKTAQALNATIHEVFPPESVFRIDHYLGKETVQNILAMRFANAMFEPIWNSNYVDHVQITMAEDIGIGGRAGYYDGIGAARDVIQNHLHAADGARSRWRSPPPSTRTACGWRSRRCSPRSCCRGGSTCTPRAASTPRAGPAARRCSATTRSRTSRPPRPPRRSRPSSSRSRAAAGPGCRSTCGTASGWAAGSPRSPWCSSGRRTCPSPRPPPRSSPTTPW